MDYIKLVEKIERFVFQNLDILEFLYLREADCKYSVIIDKIKKGKLLVQLKNEIRLFYRFRMTNDKSENLLKLFDIENEKIKAIDFKNIDSVFDLYCKLLDLFDNPLFAPRIFKIDNAADKRHP